MVRESIKYLQQFTFLGGVLIVGFLVTWFATREAVRMAEAEAELNFRGQAELYVERVVSRITNGLIAAQDLDSYYRAGDQMDEKIFQRLVTANSHFRENAVVVGVSWKVDPGIKDDFLSVLTGIYGTDFSFARDYGPILREKGTTLYPFIYAWTKDAAAFPALVTKDIGAHTAINSFFKETLEIGKPSAILMPETQYINTVRAPYMIAANPAISKAGHAFLIIQIVDLHTLLGSPVNNGGIESDVFGLEMTTAWGNGQYTMSIGKVFSADEPEDMSVKRDIGIGAGRWHFTVTPKSGSIFVDYKVAIVTACVSLLLTGLLIFFFVSQSQRAERIAGIVKRRTRALKEAHEELEDHYRLLQKMNRDVEEARKAAELANRAKSEFLATMSHELRTPLNAILGFSQLLSEEALGNIGDPRYIEYSNDIHASGTHLLSLINDILDLAKLEAGQVRIEKNPVYVKPLVSKVLTILSKQASDKGVSLSAEYSENMAECLLGDELRLRQILINLCSNAVKFTSEGSVVARLHMKHFKNGKPGWVLEVQDTGIGIPEDKQSMLFDRFTQVDAAHSRRHGGVGLGLAICRELVDRMDGKISVHSIPSVGTTIRVHLPFEEPQENEQANNNLI